MKISKSKLRQIIKEELSGVAGPGSNIDQVLYVVLDRELPEGSPAESYLRDAMKSRGQGRVMARDYVQKHGEEELLAALEAEMSKHPQLY